MKKREKIAALASALFLTISSPLTIRAAETCAGQQLARSGEIYHDSIGVVMDGHEYTGSVFTIANTAYVSLREFATAADNSVVSWNENTSTACVWTSSLTLSVRSGSNIIEANGRALWCEYGSFVNDGRLYVPLRVISSAFGFDCDYMEEEDTTYLTRKKSAIESGDTFYDADELYWLSRIIEAEAGAEPFIGKIAVGNVIVNRTRSDEFPGGIIDVIFDTENGVQFSPVSNGAIYCTPENDSILAAKLTLEGVTVSGDALYFLNAQLAKSFWIVDNCEYVMTIGSHDFYA